MISVINDINERRLEFDRVYEMVRQMGNENGKIKETLVIKSLLFLMMYNSIESTFSSCLERVHDEISKYSFIELSKNIRSLWSSFYFSNLKKENILKSLDDLQLGRQRFPSSDILLNRLKLFNGNLDLRKANVVLNSYGIKKISLHKACSDNILKIKSMRNSLAHGEKSFSDACNTQTVDEIKEVSISCFNFLEKVVENTSSYIREKSYRNN